MVLTVAETLAWYLIHPYDERNLYLYLYREHIADDRRWRWPPGCCLLPGQSAEAQCSSQLMSERRAATRHKRAASGPSALLGYAPRSRALNKAAKVVSCLRLICRCVFDPFDARHGPVVSNARACCNAATRMVCTAACAFTPK
jgi:hypothetical protein